MIDDKELNKEPLNEAIDPVEEPYDELLDAGGPAIAQSAAKNKAVLGVFGFIFLILVYFLFGGDDEPIAKEEIAAPGIVASSRTDQPKVALPSNDDEGEAPPPPPVAPPPPIAPPPIAAPSMGAPPTPGGFVGSNRSINRPAPSFMNNRGGGGGAGNSGGGLMGMFGGGGSARPQIKNAAMDTRIKAPMFSGGGGNGGGYGDGTDANGLTSFNSFSANGLIGSGRTPTKRKLLPKTGAAQISVTKAGDPRNIIFQGKVINGVLETAINTDLPGVLRALVSRDVYAEAGKRVLIPKGSRLVGSYNTDIKVGQARIYIIWNRLITPQGLDIMISSPTIDVLGRSGLAGAVDSKYLEIFGNSILLSAFTVGFAAVTEGLTGGGQVSEGETGSGDATTSGGVTDIASVQAVTDFGSTASDVISELIDVAPTVSVDQGTKINIFVNRDINFPTEAELAFEFIK